MKKEGGNKIGPSIMGCAKRLALCCFSSLSCSCHVVVVLVVSATDLCCSNASPLVNANRSTVYVCCWRCHACVATPMQAIVGLILATRCKPWTSTGCLGVCLHHAYALLLWLGCRLNHCVCVCVCVCVLIAQYQRATSRGSCCDRWPTVARCYHAHCTLSASRA